MTAKHIIIVVILLAMALLGYRIHDYKSYQQLRRQESLRIGEERCLAVTNQIDSVLRIIINEAEEVGAMLNTVGVNPDSIEQILKTAKLHPALIDVTAAYDPSVTDDYIAYAPSYDFLDSTFLFIEDEYDYTDETLTTAKWYTVTFREESERWTNPYFGEAIKQTVTDYTMPIYDSDSTVIGVFAATVGIRQLSSVVNQLSLGKTGFGFLVDSSGMIIAHPDDDKIMNSNIFDFASDKDKSSEIKNLFTKDLGYFDYVADFSGLRSTVFHSDLSLTDWKVAVVFSQDDLLGQPVKLINKTIHIVLSATWLILCIAMLVFKLDKGSTVAYWKVTITFSIMAVINIGVIWYLNNHFSFSSDQADVKIHNSTQLAAFLTNQNDIQRSFAGNEWVVIPTGFHINEITFLGGYDVGLTGRIWQKIPKSLNIDLNVPAFSFPQAVPTGIAVRTSLISKKDIGDHFLVLWYFQSSIHVGFNYTDYPFDVRDIEFLLAYPDPHAGILLAPDLGSYEVINPSSKPGLDNDIVVPNSDIKSTHFSFREIDYKSNLGDTEFIGTNEFPVMGLNIIVKRKFITIFVTNIIPFLVVVVLIFMVLYMGGKTKNSDTGLTAMNSVSSIAGFFFVLLLAHIDIRRNLGASEVTYLESFYFIGYFLLGLVAVNTVYFLLAEKKTWVVYESNLIVRILYWPVLTGSILALTIVHFYNW